jgi:hypothetical protein
MLRFGHLYVSFSEILAIFHGFFQVSIMGIMILIYGVVEIIIIIECAFINDDIVGIFIELISKISGSFKSV